MSNKPKIYGYCKAGCAWEVPHRDELIECGTFLEKHFETDLTPAEENDYVRDYGDQVCYLEIGKKYKVYPTIETEYVVNRDTAVLTWGRKDSDGKVRGETPIGGGTDEYENAFIVQIREVKVSSQQNGYTYYTVVYDYDGERRTRESSWSTADDAYAHSFQVRGKCKVLQYNEDAQLLVRGEKGDTPFIGENGNWWIGEEDTGVPASGGGGGAGVTVVQGTGESTAAVMSQDAVTKELAKKQDLLTIDTTPMPNSKNPVSSMGVIAWGQTMHEQLSAKIDKKQSKPVYETLTLSAWSELADNSPFTHSATFTASTTIGANAIVELINDNPVLFAKRGFAIASVSGQNITIYSIGQPTESVTLTVGVTNQ